MEKGSTIGIPIDKESKQLKQDERWTLYIHERTRATIGKQNKTYIKEKHWYRKETKHWSTKETQWKNTVVTGEEGNGKGTGSPKVLIGVRETE